MLDANDWKMNETVSRPQRLFWCGGETEKRIRHFKGHFALTSRGAQAAWPESSKPTSVWTQDPPQGIQSLMVKI